MYIYIYTIIYIPQIYHHICISTIYYKYHIYIYIHIIYIDIYIYEYINTINVCDIWLYTYIRGSTSQQFWGKSQMTIGWMGFPSETSHPMSATLWNSTENWHDNRKTTSWLVVSTHLKNISQIGNLPQIGVKIKNIWNHHLDKPLKMYLLFKKKGFSTTMFVFFGGYQKISNPKKTACISVSRSPSHCPLWKAQMAVHFRL